MRSFLEKIYLANDRLYFPTVDLTKNVCELVDVSGTLAATYDYAPFGEVSASSPSGTTVPANPLQWSSEIYDSELALVYYNYRHYSPYDGRFLSRDPIAEQGGRNLYAFCLNKFGYLDLQGMSFLDGLECWGDCVKDNDILDKIVDHFANKLLVLFMGGVPKRFAYHLAKMTNYKGADRIMSSANMNDPASALAWKPLKTTLFKLLNARKKEIAIRVVKYSPVVFIVYGNVMAVIETECLIYCCKNKRYNKKDGLLIFNVPRAIDFYFGDLTWADFGYEETDMLP